MAELFSKPKGKTDFFKAHENETFQWIPNLLSDMDMNTAKCSKAKNYNK